MLNIYYGGERINREKFIFENIKGKSLLLVPDQFSLQAERDAFFYMNRKSLIDLRIVDFSELGGKVVKDVGGVQPQMIDKYGRHMLLTGIAGSLDSELHVYKGLNWKTSFIDMLNGLISEMKRYDVSPEDIEGVLDSFDEGSYLRYKLADIFTIYSAYQEKIKDKYLDSEDYISFYGDMMLKSQMIAESEIWIYGFDTFTPKNLMVIERLVKASRGVNIVLTYEESNEIFSLTGYLMEQLRELAEAAGEAVQIAKIDEALGGEMRKTVWDSRGGELPPVTLAETSTMYAEAERAASYILGLVRDEGYRFGDIVVVCNDTGVRSSILKTTFLRWGIPVFMDKKRKVLHHRAVSFLLALIEIVSDGYRQEAVMKLIKSGLPGISDEDESLLENYAAEFRIRGAKWKEPFVRAGNKYDAEALERLNTLREYIVNVIETARKSMGARNSAEEKIRGLYGFLQDDFGIIGRIEDVMQRQEELGLSENAAETAQSWSVICNILDQIIEIYGREKVSNRELLKLMTAGFETVEIGIVPVSSDCVIVGTLQRTRMSRIKALVVIGANEGVLPLGKSDEGLISEREKAKLEEYSLEIAKKEPIVRQEEQMALYRTFCLPEEKLYVSCCRMSDSGEGLRPSEVFNDIKSYLEERIAEDGGCSEGATAKNCRVLSEKREGRDIGAKGKVLILGDLDINGDVEDMTASAEGTLPYIAEVFRGYLDGEHVNEEWLHVINWYRDKDSRGFSKLKNGAMFDNRLESLGEDFADSLYRGSRQELEVSASRLERYSSCPFAHFVTYGLKAESRRVYEMGAREIGDVYHKCLMEFAMGITPPRDSNIAVDSPESLWMSITEEECAAKIKNIVRNESAYYREGVLSSGREEMYRTERITEICGRIAWAMVQQVRQGRVKDMYFEYPFGRGKALEPVTVDVGDKTVLIQGKIDRMDLMEGDYVRIVDYKTGGDVIDPEYFKSGYKLQLMIYLKAALGERADTPGSLALAGHTDTLESSIPEERSDTPNPAGVFYFKILAAVKEDRASDVVDLIIHHFSRDVHFDPEASKTV